MDIHAQRDWHPARTWVVIVGTLQWKHADMFDSFPLEQRRDALLAGFFGQAGVPTAQILYLQDGHAKRQAIEQTVATHLAGAPPGALHFFFKRGPRDKMVAGGWV